MGGVYWERLPKMDILLFRELLASPLMVSELSELSSEFNSISTGYDDAVDRINSLVSSLKKLDQVWTDWSEQLKGIR